MSRGFIRDFWAHKLSDINYEPKRLVEIKRKREIGRAVIDGAGACGLRGTRPANRARNVDLWISRPKSCGIMGAKCFFLISRPTGEGYDIMVKVAF